MNNELLDKIEVWRGPLAILVCISHGVQLSLPSPYWKYEIMKMWGPLAHFAVLVFFFISGIVINYTLEQKSNIKNKFLDYFISRSTRIYPPLLFSIILIYLLKIVIIQLNIKTSTHNFDFTNRDVIAYFFMYKVSLGKVNAPLWSLILEWWFYFIGFLVFYLMKMKGIMKKSILITVMLTLIYYILKPLNENIFTYFAIWILGFLFFKYNMFNRLKKYYWILLIVTLTYLFLVDNILTSGMDYSKVWYVQLTMVLFFISILYLIPSNNFIKKSAKYSYTLYIIHYPLYLFFNALSYEFKPSINPLIILSVTTILIILISKFSAQFFENKYLFKKLIYQTIKSKNE